MNNLIESLQFGLVVGMYILIMATWFMVSDTHDKVIAVSESCKVVVENER